MTVPRSSTISMVTSDGLGNPSSQNSTRTVPIEEHTPMPLHSILMPPDTCIMDDSIPATVRSMSSGSVSALITPHSLPTARTQSSARIQLDV